MTKGTVYKNWLKPCKRNKGSTRYLLQKCLKEDFLPNQSRPKVSPKQGIERELFVHRVVAYKGRRAIHWVLLDARNMLDQKCMREDSRKSSAGYCRNGSDLGLQ